MTTFESQVDGVLNLIGSRFFKDVFPSGTPSRAGDCWELSNPPRIINHLMDITKAKYKDELKTGNGLKPYTFCINNNKEFTTEQLFGPKEGVLRVHKTTLYFFICVRAHDAGGAYWTDGKKELPLERGEMFPCGPGNLKTEKDKGGVYLALVNRIPQESVYGQIVIAL